MTRLASNEIFSPSNKIHREVGRAKDLSSPRYYPHIANRTMFHCGVTPWSHTLRHFTCECWFL